MEEIKKISDIGKQESSAQIRKMNALLEGKKVDPYQKELALSPSERLKERLKNISFPSDLPKMQKNEIKELMQNKIEHAQQIKNLLESQTKLDYVKNYIKKVNNAIDNIDKLNTQKSVEDFIKDLSDFSDFADKLSTEIYQKVEPEKYLQAIEEKAKDSTNNSSTTQFILENSKQYDANNLKFAHVLTNVSQDNTDKHSSKSGNGNSESTNDKIAKIMNEASSTKDNHQFASSFSGELRELMKKNLLKPSPEAERMKKRNEKLVETTQNKSIEKKQALVEAQAKHEELAIDIEKVIYDSALEKDEKNEQLSRNRERLLETIPILNEKERFFDIVFGERAHEFKRLVKEVHKDNLKDRMKENNKNISDTKAEKISETKDIIEDENINTNEKASELIDKTPNNSLNSLTHAPITAKTISNLVNDFSKGVDLSLYEISQHINSMMNSFSANNIDEFSKIIEESLQRISNMKNESQKMKDKLDNLLSEDDTVKLIDINRPINSPSEAISIAEEITQTINLKKIDDVQKKMTPWAVSQLLY